MKFKLNAKDRLIIPNLLPAESTMLEQAVVKEIIAKVTLESKDFGKYGIEENLSGNLDGLDPKKNPKILIEEEVDFNKIQLDLLKDSIEKKDNDKKINQAIYDTCERIKKMR